MSIKLQSSESWSSTNSCFSFTKDLNSVSKELSTGSPAFVLVSIFSTSKLVDPKDEFFEAVIPSLCCKLDIDSFRVSVNSLSFPRACSVALGVEKNMQLDMYGAWLG